MPSYVNSLIPLALLAVPLVLARRLANKGSVSETRGGRARAAVLACLVVGLMLVVAAGPARVDAAENAVEQATEAAEKAEPEPDAQKAVEKPEAKPVEETPAGAEGEDEAEPKPAEAGAEPGKAPVPVLKSAEGKDVQKPEAKPAEETPAGAEGEDEAEPKPADAGAEPGEAPGPVLKSAEGEAAEKPEAKPAEEAPAGAEGEAEAEPAPGQAAEEDEVIISWWGGTLFNFVLLAVLLAVLLGPFHLGRKATSRWREPLWGWVIGAVLLCGAVMAAVYLLRWLVGFLPVEYGKVLEGYLKGVAGAWKLWVFIGLIAVPAWIGAFLSKRFRMPDYSFRIAVIFFCILAGVVIIVLGWPPKLGIDLSGGVILVYEFEGRVEGDRADQGEAKEGEEAEGDEEQEEADETEPVNMDELVQAIRLRIDPGGLRELTIRQRGENQIEVIIPEATDEDLARIKRRISRAGTLEFRILANQRDHGDLIEKAGKMEGITLRDPETGERLAWWVEVIEEEKEDLQRSEQVSELVSRDRQLGDRKWTEFLVVDDPFNVTGKYLTRADSGVDEGGWKVLFTFNHRGGRLFGALTARNLPDKTQDFNRHLGIVLDGKLQSAPTIQETITRRGQISGRSFTSQDVEDLVAVLNAGKLPTTLSEKPVSEIRIGALLGQDTIRRGRIAIGVSLVLVLAFMVYYYRFAGLVACLALVMNLILILAVMISVRAAFTLPGLAGLVLTVGMAVDANVLIFERIREELARQAALRMAIRNGFDRATTAIVDANVTTLIVATVLYVIGTDQIRGFATILWLGVALSMFTAIYCSRVVFDVAERQRWISKLNMKRMVGKTEIDFLGKRRVAALVSLVMIVIGLLAVLGRGSGLLDIDFTGGVSVQVEFSQPKPNRSSEIRGKLGDDGARLEDLQVSPLQTLDDPREGMRFMINTSGPREMLENAKQENAKLEPEEVLAEVESRIKEAFGPELDHYSMEYAVLPQEAADEGTAEEPPPDQTRAQLDLDHNFSYETLMEKVEEQIEKQAAAGTLERKKVAFELFPTKEFRTVDPEKVLKTWFLELRLPRDQAETVLDGLEAQVTSEPVFPSSNTIGTQVARKTQVDAIVALLASLVFIVGYIWIRFQRVMFGLAAVLALVHDVLITLGVIALTAYLAMVPLHGFLMIDEFKIGLAVLAAFLTIIGYSLNDTIVVFDRIREVRGKAPRLTGEMINTSINQTLSRTLLTSLTTLLVVAVLYVGGGQGIHVFAFALVVGVVVGTYSSIFVASPVLFWMIQRSGPQGKGRVSSRAA